MLNLGSLLKGLISGWFENRREVKAKERSSKAERETAMHFIKEQVKLIKDDMENGIFAKTGIQRGSKEGKAITSAFVRFYRPERLRKMVMMLDTILDGRSEDTTE